MKMGLGWTADKMGWTGLGEFFDYGDEPSGDFLISWMKSLYHEVTLRNWQLDLTMIGRC
jgi:hypothetical protein